MNLPSRDLRQSFWIGMMAAILAAVLAYGIFVEPDWLEVTHHVVGENKGRASFRLVQLSDLHLQGHENKRIISKVREIQPDLIVLSGDVVDRSDSLPGLEAFLKSLGDTPKVAILGNWEYWGEFDLNELAKVYARNQVRLLVNACAQIQIKNRTVTLVGLDDALAGKPNIKRAAAQCGDAEDAILIEHSPGFFGKPREAPMTDAPFLLSMSGHTHGGQLALFGHPLATPPGSGAYTQGWYDSKYGRLYVSRGIGTSELPVRIGARPEIAVFEIN